jgi:hypothetical protein
MYKEFVNKQAVKVIIPVGHRDFGRCPVASRVPMALWPVAEKSVLYLAPLTNMLSFSRNSILHLFGSNQR